MTTVDYLDRHTPIRYTLGASIFDSMIVHWLDAKTVALEVQRATLNDARAWMATQRPRQPSLHLRETHKRMRPTSITETAPQGFPAIGIDDPEPLTLVAERHVQWSAPTSTDLAESRAIWDEQPGFFSRAATRVGAFLARRGFHRARDGESRER